MSKDKSEKPVILKFVKPEMDIYIDEEENLPKQKKHKLPGHTSKWTKRNQEQNGHTVCTCNQVCTCNLVRTGGRRRGGGGYRRRRGGGGGYRRVCTCVPVAH